MPARSPDYFYSRADELERDCESMTDPALKAECLKLARALRGMGESVAVSNEQAQLSASSNGIRKS